MNSVARRASRASAAEAKTSLSTTTNTPIMRTCLPISMPAWEPTSSSPAEERNSVGIVALGARGGISALSGPLAFRPVRRKT